MTTDNKQLSRSEAWMYLTHELDRNLALLGALEYDTIKGLYGVRRAGALAGVIVVTEQSWAHNDAAMTMMAAADDADALTDLLAQADWPRAAIWSVRRRGLLPVLEDITGAASDPERGVIYFVAQSVSERIREAARSYAKADAADALVRQLTIADADLLDLTPCSLSAVALRNWIKRGWRVFGAVESDALLGHALAAYPIADTEEVAAVFTAPDARRRGIASALAAAAIADITARGLRAIYVTKKHNIASRRVATRLGLTQLFETWEIVTR
jgi:predicted GNAT family acetyltransferase